MLGRHFEHVLWSNEFYDAMEDVDFIFILQKPTNMIGHLGGGSFLVCSLAPSMIIFLSFKQIILKMLSKMTMWMFS